VPAVLKIVQAGDPVLRCRARALTVDELLSPRIQVLIELMRDTMRDAPGVGLAAPQIGESIQLVVIEDAAERQANLTAEQRAERRREVIPFHVLANPELTVVDPGTLDYFEGCLSVRDRVMIVPRPASVRVTALGPDAQPIEINATGWYARILQHEIDHLHGTLCIDRMNPRTFMSVELHQRFWARLSPADVLAALGSPGDS
jgi:peptide deformylase